MFIISNLNRSMLLDEVANLKFKTDPIMLNCNQNLKTPGQKLTHLALEITNIILHDADFLKNQTNKSALIIFNDADLNKITDKMINSIAADAIYFSSVSYNDDKHWMLGSVQACLKILRSASKLLDFNIIENITTNVDDTAGKYFQLVWLAQRVGLKVYEPVDHRLSMKFYEP